MTDVPFSYSVIHRPVETGNAMTDSDDDQHDPDHRAEHDAQHKVLLELFEHFDRNGDGRIDEDEFGQILDKLGSESSPEVRSLEFAAMDANADGEVEFKEFADWWFDHE